MRTVYISRHGQDEDNAQGILNGRRDKPLTYIGKQQAELVGEKIRKAGLHFDAIYTSPLLRTRQTAQIITDECGGPTPHVLENLIERDFGTMTGKLQADITTLCAPNIITTNTIVYFLSPEGAETFPSLIVRAHTLLQEINSKHASGSVLLVTHGDFGKMIYAAYYNLPWEDVLTQFHFGNSELLLLSPDSPATDAHVFKIKQHNT
jgi:probable phosphoglycerate mutase